MQSSFSFQPRLPQQLLPQQLLPQQHLPQQLLPQQMSHLVTMRQTTYSLYNRVQFYQL